MKITSKRYAQKTPKSIIFKVAIALLIKYHVFKMYTDFLIVIVVLFILWSNFKCDLISIVILFLLHSYFYCSRISIVVLFLLWSFSLAILFQLRLISMFVLFLMRSSCDPISKSVELKKDKNYLNRDTIGLCTRVVLLNVVLFLFS